MSDPAESTGVLTTFRRLGSTLLAILGNRLELFVVELQEERTRVIGVLTLLLLALLFGGFALALVTGTVVYLLWSTHPVFALLSVAACYAAAAGVAWARAQRLLHESEPFSASLAEFKKDQQCFHPGPPTSSKSANDSSSSKAS